MVGGEWEGGHNSDPALGDCGHIWEACRQAAHYVFTAFLHC
jgi:hypothetical protein